MGTAIVTWELEFRSESSLTSGYIDVAVEEKVVDVSPQSEEKEYLRQGEAKNPGPFDLFEAWRKVKSFVLRPL